MTKPIRIKRNDQCLKPSCNAKVPFYQRHCLVCATDAGFPNVRAAKRESKTLDQRYKASIKKATKAQTIDVVQQFEESLKKSHAIMVKSVIDVIGLVGTRNRLLATFGNQIEAGMRYAEDNIWDDARIVAEPIIHSHYHKEIQYAVLSLDNLGASDPGYGACHIKFHESSYEDRATVFEENTIKFVEKHNILATDPVPVGYRATWSERHKLAVSKLEGILRSNRDDLDFTELLRRGTGKEADFIEVHIFGAIDPSAIETISYVTPCGPNESDAISLKLLEIHAKKMGIPVKIVTSTKRAKK